MEIVSQHATVFFIGLVWKQQRLRLRWAVAEFCKIEVMFSVFRSVKSGPCGWRFGARLDLQNRRANYLGRAEGWHDEGENQHGDERPRHSITE